MRAILFVMLTLVLALADLSSAQAQDGLQSRITPVDDGTIQINEIEYGQGSSSDESILFTDIDSSGSNISTDADHKGGYLAYLRFNLSGLGQVSDKSLVALKIYTDNSRNISEMLILSGRMLSIVDGTSQTGALMQVHDIGKEQPGFALCDVTDQVRALQRLGQSDIVIFFFGDGLTFGTIESRSPAEIIVI